MNATMHNVKNTDGYVWPPTRYLPKTYVSLKIRDKYEGELTLFMNKVEEIDMLLDELGTLRRELAKALEEDNSEAISDDKPSDIACGQAVG